MDLYGTAKIYGSVIMLSRSIVFKTFMLVVILGALPASADLTLSNGSDITMLGSAVPLIQYLELTPSLVVVVAIPFTITTIPL